MDAIKAPPAPAGDGEPSRAPTVRRKSSDRELERQGNGRGAPIGIRG